MKFAMLGALLVQGEQGQARIGPRRHRELLVCLLQEAGRPVPADRLVERLWGDRASAGSVGTLQGYVSLLRRELARIDPGGQERLVHSGAGYRLAVSDEELDVRCFEELLGSATAALSSGEAERAWDLFARALGLWRGAPLQDGPDDAVTAAEVARLEQHRLAALTGWADAGLHLGRHSELVGELEAACATNPLHEGLWARRVIALYRTGRQADSLAACHSLRTLLVDEAGLEPSAELRDLERAVLSQDPSLKWVPAVRSNRTAGPARSLDRAAPAVPPVRYARFGRHEIAYQVWGRASGPTLVGLPGFAQNIELLWEEPAAARWLRGLGEFCRVVHFDKLGSGLSSRGTPMSSFTDRAGELEAVMDACRLEHAFVGGFSDGGTAATMFAATRPGRVDGLVLLGTTASWVRRPDMPWARTAEEIRALARRWSASWGTGEFTIALLAPSMTGDMAYREWMARYERHSLTPGEVVELWELNIDLDVRPLLASLQVPTLILHRLDDTIDVRSAGYLAEHIRGARLEVLAGRDHLPWLGDAESVIDQIRQFVCNRPPERTAQRTLATVVCVIPDGTADQRRTAAGGCASPCGDGAWSARRATMARFGSTTTWMGNAAGDPCLYAAFDTPTAAVHAGWQIIAGGAGTALRVGIHTGEIDRGGAAQGGPAAQIACDLARVAAPGEVRASGATRDLCAGTGPRFDERDCLEVHGFGPLRAYAARRDTGGPGKQIGDH